MSKYLGEASGGRANNSAFVRFLLTSSVIYSHSFFFMWGTSASEPIAWLTQQQASAGALAVEGFLILSGFLITRSWFFSRGAKDFLFRRVLRIYPAFMTAVVLCGVIGVPWLASFSPEPGPVAFWNDLIFPALLLRYTPLWSNGSLWILPYEFACYLVVAIFGLCGVLSRRRLILGLWALNFGVYACQLRFGMFRGHDLQISRLLNCFLAGSAFFLYRDSIRLSRAGFVGAVLGLTLFGGTLASWRLLPFVSPILLGYVLLFACYYRIGRLQHFARYGDFSYGTYLYAYPTQLVFVMYFAPWLHPLTLFAIALPIAMSFGALSWFLIERPFLRLKRSSSAASRPVPAATDSVAPIISSPYAGMKRPARALQGGAGALLRSTSE